MAIGKSIQGSKTRLRDQWPLMTEQDIKAALQLILLSSTDSSASCNLDDLLDYISTATKRGLTTKHEIESENKKNNDGKSYSHVDYTADDVSCFSPVMESKGNVKKRKFRTMEELYRVTKANQYVLGHDIVEVNGNMAMKAKFQIAKRKRLGGGTEKHELWVDELLAI